MNHREGFAESIFIVELFIFLEMFELWIFLMCWRKRLVCPENLFTISC